MIKITLPLTEEAVKNLHAGDRVLLSGDIYTGRDAAHKRIVEAIRCGTTLPFPLQNSTVYYVGACPPKGDLATASCGPTTSFRMSPYAPTLIKNGQRGIIGKGSMSEEVRNALIEHTAVYFAAIGGAGGLYAQCVTDAEILAYEDLGTEAVRRFTVKDFPVVVAYDCHGKSVYE